jgi:hypothetical protein
VFIKNKLRQFVRRRGGWGALIYRGGLSTDRTSWRFWPAAVQPACGRAGRR